MFGSGVLDTAIGLIFVFLLVSILVTIANELIASVLSSRSQWLAAGMQTLLGAKLAAALYAHPLIGGADPAKLADDVARAQWPWVDRLTKLPVIGKALALLRQLANWERLATGKPSYIASRSFANVLLDIIRENASGVIDARDAVQAEVDTLHAGETTAAFAARVASAADGLGPEAKYLAAGLRRLAAQLPESRPLDQARIDVQAFLDAVHQHGLRDGIEALATDAERAASGLQKTLRVLLNDAGGDLEKFKENIEIWFNNAMDRVGGWYKRRSQSVILILGMTIAVVMNVDALMIVRFLETNPGVRDALVAQAKSYADSKEAVAERAALDNGRTAGTDEAKPLPPAAAAAQGKGAPEAATGTGLPQQFEAIQSLLQQLDLPIGWVRAPNSRATDRAQFNVVPDSARGLLRTLGFHLIGWLVTALAATLGAPFWFDILNRTVSIRSAGRAPEEKPKAPKAVQQPLEPGESPKEAEAANARQPA